MAMETPARFFGHPVHPTLVAFPIGLWGFSFVCDLMFAFGSGSVLWNELAFHAMAGGLLGAFAATVPGLVDYASLSEPRVRRLGALHLFLNAVIIGLYVVNLWIRNGHAHEVALPVALSLLGVSLLLVSTWIGGEMVYVHGVAVERSRVPTEPERQKHVA